MDAVLPDVYLPGDVAVSSFVALRKDVARKSLELLAVTKMKPIDVLFGIWSALNYQAVLLGSRMAPFITLGYYSGGGSNPVWNLIVLFELWMISGTLCATAITVASSSDFFDGVGTCMMAALCWAPLFFLWLCFSSLEAYSLTQGNVGIAMAAKCFFAAACLLYTNLGVRMAL